MASNRRHRVALRPKVRRRRLRMLAAAGAIVFLASAAGLTIRHLSFSLPSASSLLGRLDFRVGHVAVEGVPAPLAGAMEAYFNEPGGSFRSRLAAFPGRFPAVKDWKVRRDWSGHGARLAVRLRRAAARLERAGRPAGFLDEDGAAFAAPAELYPDARLCVEARGARPEQLQGLPALLALLAGDEDLPAPLAAVSFRGAYEGWELGLQDGTQVLWGGLDWSREKLSRLREALADARAGTPTVSSPLLADLRYFEDGRVLLRPLAGNRIPAR